MADLGSAALCDEDLRLLPTVEIGRQHVVHDADHLDDRVRSEPSWKQAREAPAHQRPSVGEVGPGEGCVDQDGPARCGQVAGPQEASFAQTHAQRLGVPWRDHRAQGRRHHGPATRIRHAGQPEAEAGQHAAKGGHVARARRSDAGRRPQSLDNRQRHLRRERLRGIARQADIGRHDAGRVISGVHAKQRDEAAPEQTRSDQKHHGERRFVRDEHAAEASWGCAGAVPAAPHVGGQIGAGAPERRNDGGQHPDDDGRERRRGDEQAVGANLIEAREVRRRHEREQLRQRPPCGQPQRPTDQRKHEALDHHLLHEPRPRRAESRAHPELAGAIAGAREEQIGEVRAGDQQHERHRRGQHLERGPHARRHVVDERSGADVDRTALAEDQVGHRTLDGAGAGAALGFRLREGHARLQARERLRVVDDGRAGRRLDGQRRIQADRLAVVTQPDFLVGKGEARRRHADDVVMNAIDDDRPADHSGVAPEPVAPEAVREDHHGRRPLLRVRGHEESASSGRDAQQGEQPRRDARTPHALRPFRRADRVVPTAERGDAVDRVRGSRPRPVGRSAQLGPGDRLARAGMLFPQPDEPIGLRIRQRAEQHAVGDAEDRRGPADGKRDGDHGGGGKAPVCRHRPERAADVSGYARHLRIPFVDLRDNSWPTVRA